MIMYNGNKIETLDDKFYLGSTQVGKVYLGSTLIYPKVQNQVIIDGVEVNLAPMNRNGNVYDTGYAPNKDTCFEVAFSYNPSGNYSEEGFFGTHHNNGTSEENLDEDVVNRDYKWKTNTTLHFIIYPSRSGKSSMRFRYGGPSIEAKNYTPSIYDKAISSSDGIDLSTIDPEYNEPVFFFTVRRNRWGWGYGVGPYLKGSSAQYAAQYYINETGTPTSSSNTVYRSSYSYTQVGGNLWIGAINRNYSSTSSDVEPNLTRNNFPFSTDFSHTPINFSTDINASRWSKSNTSFLYVLLWDETSNGDITNKCLYTPHRTNVLDPNNQSASGDEKYFLAFHRQIWDGVNNCFLPADKIIMPFMHL